MGLYHWRALEILYLIFEQTDLINKQHALKVNDTIV